MNNVPLYKQVFDNEKSVIALFRAKYQELEQGKIDSTDFDFYRCQSYLDHKLNDAYQNYTSFFHAPSHCKDKFWSLVHYGKPQEDIAFKFDRVGTLGPLPTKEITDWRVASFIYHHQKLIDLRKYLRVNFECTYNCHHKEIYHSALKALDLTLGQLLSVDISPDYGDNTDTLPFWLAIDQAS